ncbi:hypothetical protein AAG906_026049 [Vitis piasezkii]
MEARLAKVELAMEDTWEGVDLIKMEVLKPQGFSGKRDAKELDNLLWHMERYFEAIALTDKAAKDFKREIKRQFYLEDVAYLARKNMRYLKHIGSIRDYVKEFSSLMLEIPKMNKMELLFNFMITCKDGHAMGGGDEVSMDHNAPRIGSNKAFNSKINLLVHNYELFFMKDNETIVEMITKFTDIVNSLETLGKTYKESEKVMKILRSLPTKLDAKVIVIQEAKDLTKVPLEELIGYLMTFEITLANKQ